MTALQSGPPGVNTCFGIAPGVTKEAATGLGNWFSKLFAWRRNEPRLPAPAQPVADEAGAYVIRRPASPSRHDPRATRLKPDQVEFLAAFLEPPAVRSLDELLLDDRQFIAGIQKRWHARKLELPVLPDAAIRLREMLHAGDAPVSRYVEVLESDSALSIEVLKTANSVAYGGSASVDRVHDAVVRIGLERLVEA